MYSYDEITLLRLQLGRWAPYQKQHPREHPKIGELSETYKKMPLSPRGQKRISGRLTSFFRRQKQIRQAGP